jgi:hypothetical protein
MLLKLIMYLYKSSIQTVVANPGLLHTFTQVFDYKSLITVLRKLHGVTNGSNHITSNLQ